MRKPTAARVDRDHLRAGAAIQEQSLATAGKVLRLHNPANGSRRKQGQRQLDVQHTSPPQRLHPLDGLGRRDLSGRQFEPGRVQGGGNRNNPGLGLTLVHSVVMDMGGHIWADSTLHHGTTIHMLIPVNV